MDNDSIAEGTQPDTITKDGTIYVAEKKKTHLLMAILLMAAGMFLVVGIASLGTIVGLIQAFVMTWLSGLTGWDPLISSLFIGVMGLFLATLLYVLARRGSEVAQKIEAALKLNVTNEPTEYYALDMIPHEELLHEFRKRGCVVSKMEGKGVSVTCDDIPHSRRILGVVDPPDVSLTRMQQIAVIAVVLVMWSIYIGALLYDILIGDLIWITAVGILITSAIVLLGSRIIRLWHTVILWTGVNIVFSLFFATDPTVVWSLWGAEAIYIVLIAVLYLLYRGWCEMGDKWYCDVM